MGTPAFALIVLAAAALYFMKPDERRRLAQAAAARVRALLRSVRETHEPYDALDALMRERSPRVIVTPLLIGLCVWMWLVATMSGAPDPQRLIEYGASYAPQTTHGEWWRLATYAFVHDGVLPLLGTIAALLTLGTVLERLTGRLTVAFVFVASAVGAGAVSLWTSSAVAVNAGAAPAVLGLVGLGIAGAVYGYLRAPRLPLSRITGKRIAVGCGLFLLITLASDAIGSAAAWTAVVTGIVAGLVALPRVTERQPSIGRGALVPAAAIVLAAAAVLPMRGTIDARPELARIADVETHTAAEYAKAVDGFTRGRLPSKALVQIIERSILPALAADRARIDTLRGVPREQTPLVALADRYFDVRQASWKRRLDALRGSNMKALREADQVERSALAHFDRLQHELSATPLS